MAARQTYEELVKSPGSVLESVDDRNRIVNTINQFLKEYPKQMKPAPNDPWVNASVRDLTRKTIETAIDIINDVSTLVSNRDQYSNAQYRRQMLYVFTQPERRLYVGFWLIFISFVLYFIDSSA